MYTNPHIKPLAHSAIHRSFFFANNFSRRSPGSDMKVDIIGSKMKVKVFFEKLRKLVSDVGVTVTPNIDKVGHGG